MATATKKPTPVATEEMVTAFLKYLKTEGLLAVENLLIGKRDGQFVFAMPGKIEADPFSGDSDAEFGPEKQYVLTPEQFQRISAADAYTTGLRNNGPFRYFG